MHVVALTERYNVKYIADLSVQLGQEKDLHKTIFVVGQEKKYFGLNRICKAVEYLANNIYIKIFIFAEERKRWMLLC